MKSAMRFLVVGLFIALAYVLTAYFFMSGTGIYGPTIKILLKPYWTLSGRGGQPEADSKKLPPPTIKQIQCNTWPVISDLVVTIFIDIKQLCVEIERYTDNMVAFQEKSVDSIDVIVDEFKYRLKSVQAMIKDDPGPTKTILKQIDKQLDTIYTDILNSTKTTALSVYEKSDESARKIRDHIWGIMNVVYRSVVELQEVEPEILECVCDAVQEADKLYVQQYVNLKGCAEDFDINSQAIFNNTIYNFVVITELTYSEVVEAVGTHSLVEIMYDLPVKVRFLLPFKCKHDFH